jgi:hypothetical protein
MAAIQEISARLGRVTGRGIAGNMRRNSAADAAEALRPIAGPFAAAFQSQAYSHCPFSADRPLMQSARLCNGV